MTAKRAPLGTKSGAGPHFTAIADATGPWACRTNGMASATTATARRRIVGSELRGGEEHSRDSGDGKRCRVIPEHSMAVATPAARSRALDGLAPPRLRTIGR